MGASMAWAGKTVTVWIPGEIRIDPATTRIATISKVQGRAEFSEACAEEGGKLDTYSAMIIDLGLGTTHLVEIVSEKLPGKGLAIDLSSLRAEGECTEAGRKWNRFNAVVTEPADKESNPR